VFSFRLSVHLFDPLYAPGPPSFLCRSIGPNSGIKFLLNLMLASSSCGLHAHDCCYVNTVGRP
jgi:hypothetical protein